MRVRITGTGSRESRDAADGALAAAIDALAAAGCRPHDVGCVTVAVTGDDGGSGGRASTLSAQLGLTGRPAFEVHDRASAFLCALSVSEHFVRLGTYPTALVAAVDSGSSGGAGAHRAAAVLLAAGAGDQRGILGVGLRHDGRFDRAEMARGNGGRAVTAIDEALRTTGVAPRDVALVVASPAPPAAASHLPSRLDAALRARRVGEGDVVLLVSCGSGLTWGWAMLRC